MTDICLFPLPNCVTFPGTVFPLHVFEPRYRKMINYCIDNNVLLGISHTRKMIRPAKTNQTTSEALKSNQATYQPYDVFSAGKCELIDTTDDGRMYLNVHITQRYKTVQEKQTLPFLIHQSEVYQDQPLNEAQQLEAESLKAQILIKLHKLLESQPDLIEKLEKAHFEEKTVSAFSFELFGFLNFEAEIQQQILTSDSPIERLSIASELLNNY